MTPANLGLQCPQAGPVVLAPGLACDFVRKVFVSPPWRIQMLTATLFACLRLALRR